MSEPRSPKELFWLRDILEAIAEIDSHPSFSLGQSAFLEDKFFRVWVFYHIERIGECVGKLRKQYHYDRNHPEVNWEGIVGLRNLLVHWYWGINNARVWDDLTSGLPALKQKIEQVIEDIESKKNGIEYGDDSNGDLEVRQSRLARRLQEESLKR